MDLKPTIFLDIDGVCNQHPESWRKDFNPDQGGPIERDVVKLITDMVKSLDGQIVISSAWRILHTRETFIAAFGPEMGELLAPGDAWRTDNFAALRGEQVAVWLDRYGWRPYACIDDEVDYYTWQPVVYTNMKVGATAADVMALRGLVLTQMIEGVWHAGVRLQHSDMLESDNVIVAHGCNAQGAMGSGAALAVITKYPQNKKTYQAAHRKNGLRLGQVVWHMELHKKRIIANCITQEFAGSDGRKYVDYDAIRISYSEVANIALSNGWGAIATCQVGAGLAGGDWDTIVKILEEVAMDKGITIVVHQPDYKKYYDAYSQYRSYAHAQWAKAEAATI